MALTVPPPLVRRVTRSPSVSSLQRSVEHENDLTPVSLRTSRRNSDSNLSSSQALPPALVQKPTSSVSASAPSIAVAAERAALVAIPEQLLHRPETRKGMISLYAGPNHKQFEFHTAQLAEKSPYFEKFLAETEGHDGSLGSPEQETYKDLDELAMALFHHWLDDGGKLAGPHDFHSLQHYLGLYVLARKFEIEVLENQGEYH